MALGEIANTLRHGRLPGPRLRTSRRALAGLAG